MNIAIKKTKLLVETFAELSEKDQDEILTMTYDKYLKGLGRNNLKKTGMVFKTKDAEDKAVEERTLELLRTCNNISDAIDNASDMNAAILLYTLYDALDIKNTSDREIEIVLKEKRISVTKILKDKFPGLDVDAVIKQASPYCAEIKSKLNASKTENEDAPKM